MRFEATRSFVKLVELGSYAAAAEALYMSTTTLHSHVKAIEAELATVLVKFKGRQLVLTVDGQSSSASRSEPPASSRSFGAVFRGTRAVSERSCALRACTAPRTTCCLP